MSKGAGRIGVQMVLDPDTHVLLIFILVGLV